MSVPGEPPRAPQSGREWCTCCLEETLDDQITKIHGNAICFECFSTGIRPQFEAALLSEAAWPVLWSGQVIEPYKHTALLPPDFCGQWTEKLKEYGTPVTQRIYRHGFLADEQCGRFIKAKPDVIEDCNCTAKCFVAECRTCWTQVCTSCSGVATNFTVHICQSEGKDDFEGLQRGVDYQKCPNTDCRVKLALRDGYNHMQCKYCQWSLCFRCGGKVEEGEAHWTKPNPCPRWGAPNDPRAEWDGDDDEEEEDEEDGEEDGEDGEDDREANEEAQRFTANTREGRLLQTDRDILPSMLSTLRLLAYIPHTYAPDFSELRPSLRTIQSSERALHAGVLGWITREGHYLTQVPGLAGVVAGYVDAWDSFEARLLLSRSSGGRLRSEHRSALVRARGRMYDLRDAGYESDWLELGIKCCETLWIGINVHVRRFRMSRQSEMLSETLEGIFHRCYVGVIAALRASVSNGADEYAEEISHILMPVIEAYEKAMDLQARGEWNE
ncbi:Putative IBR domain, TRIAD supradomain-containing protein [Septoria linicola]|uniref:IBR domain, TRIAD supradomain-containing protein n=1 Tax=Septoria linicola TaxID=215465 RepID=A0A9Q9AVG0_9PEZI|nr:putative IBR domain, TRIAD supradomain-containing protein [Septoria linicola]USW51431.1 Putative IBR domain, TRIAD supradomain-containing protein [Septoria linicola]